MTVSIATPTMVKVVVFASAVKKVCPVSPVNRSVKFFSPTKVLPWLTKPVFGSTPVFLW
ncbi:hypothetical protein [Fodinicola feengrottensis]|uniref:hypothetical protein n=1 Tax=Fodinicola feengrottensis TaxID=435914 RepID=UPI0024415A9F|nr:hypothetical protein [Fodinicola feengrottensis]